MASVILGNIGSSLGGAFGALGSSIGGAVGRYAGGMVNDVIMGNNRHRVRYREGRRLDDIRIQTSQYGIPIPIVFGTMRVAGNIIWAMPIKEHVYTSSTTQGGGKFGIGPKLTQTSTDYSYTITMAIAICEGEIESIVRVWADNQLLDLSLGTYRLYTGTQTQLPDVMMEMVEGVGQVPAYRELAYVVMEDFPLTPFNNHIPDLVFEVKRKHHDINDALEPEQLVKAVTLIPGSGEWVYDTTIAEKQLATPLPSGGFVPQGKRIAINQHTTTGEADVMVALDQLQDTFPHLEWVAPVVAWFGTSLDCGMCDVLPGVEEGNTIITSPEAWSVAAWNRGTARAISKDENGRPRYGGTPHDGSVIRLLKELKKRGLKVMFYPMLQLDIEGKPWRGRISGTAASIETFFEKQNGYNAFILHYARLVKDLVDGFIIGSEFKGMTGVMRQGVTGDNRFPAAQKLKSLAIQVKSIVGHNVNVTYAADWSEYHSHEGWYTLDPLWGSSAIDMVGIDAYFPLSEGSQDMQYRVEILKQRWQSGEGYDYYRDEQGHKKLYNTPVYAWKNMRYWWEHPHINPDGTPTAWQAQSKPIWFTEYGFPSVDAATNEPNRFIDHSSQENGFPRDSKQVVDTLAQRAGITATERYFQHSNMVGMKFLWTWDARPYPYFPDHADIWSDGNNWQTGHWVQGKMGLAQLGSVVLALLARCGISSTSVDVSSLRGIVMGYVIHKPMTYLDVLADLQDVYAFDVLERGQQLVAKHRSDIDIIDIAEGDVVLSPQQLPLKWISQEAKEQLAMQTDIHYLDVAQPQQPTTATFKYTERGHIDPSATITGMLPMALVANSAAAVSERLLWEQHQAASKLRIVLPMRYVTLQLGDYIRLAEDSLMRVTSVSFHHHHVVIEAEGINTQLYGDVQRSLPVPNIQTPLLPVADTVAFVFELPAMNPDTTQAIQPVYIAACGTGDNWPGTQLYLSENQGSAYQWLMSINKSATMGYAVTTLAPASAVLWDEAQSVEVTLLHGQLFHADHSQVYAGANLALIGDELVQFRTAERIGEYRYRLRGLLRARFGTDHAMVHHVAGERFILITPDLATVTPSLAWLGLERWLQIRTIGSQLQVEPTHRYLYQGMGFRPLSPVHIHVQRYNDGALDIAWTRRTRMLGQWRDGLDVALGEESERYEVELLQMGNIVGQYSASSPRILVPFIVVDEIRIYALSTIVGRGWVGSYVISG